MSCDGSDLVRPWTPPTADEVLAMQALGRKLRHWRRSRVRALANARSVKTSDLARAAGISANRVNSLERGASRTRLSTLRNVVSALVRLRPALGKVEERLAELYSIPHISFAPEATAPDCAREEAQSEGSAVAEPCSTAPPARVATEGSQREAQSARSAGFGAQSVAA